MLFYEFVSRFKLLLAVSLGFDVDYKVVPEGEEPHEELDLKDLPRWEVVEESSCPSFIVLNQRSIRLTECFMDPFEAKGF
jgi:hypothetical protein